MVENELKWYEIVSIFFGIILGFADPITDILTLVEFYPEDHKTWFGVGLSFIILPLLYFSIINVLQTYNGQNVECWNCCWTTCTFGCIPLFPALMKLRVLIVYLKKKFPNVWRDNNIESPDNRTNENPLNDMNQLLEFRKLAVLAEAVLESAPQFIIQLYAMAVQQQSVTIIQMVSLPVSFLSLAWASTVADDVGPEVTDFNVKNKLLLFSTHVFILSSRLFAIALFTVSFKWWVIILIFHCFVMVICDIIWFCRFSNGVRAMAPAILFCFQWLRDDTTLTIRETTLNARERAENQEKQLRRKQLSNVLFVIENFIMILLFYFSHFPHTWYSLPVTICVCLFSVLGAFMRLTHFYFLKRESAARSNDIDQALEELGSYFNPRVDEA